MAVREAQGKRPYDSSGRRARAAATRRQIVDAAHRLFVTQGFAGTTIAAVAKQAGVSAPTVYATFTSKAELLRAAIDLALAGDPEPVAVADRPIGRWVYEADGPVELLSRYAVMMGEVAERAAPIYKVLVAAADVEAELADLLADFEKQRLKASTMIAEAVRDRGGLPEGRSLAEARDTVWVCNAPDLYLWLTTKRRWSKKRYVDWARNMLIKLVVEPEVSQGPG
ncbi:MAG: TetR/AcrR family transcriptional regulator [Actinomycetota bacterium]|nr:TetR/AcrR family transcriptional regulator [Actinomycetota bacterium]